MSRLFLTNIDLNTNELQNAVIQNLSSAPQSGNKEGRIYYDVTAKALYLYTNGTWKQLASGGAAASSLELTGDVTGTASVDSATGKITLQTTVVNNSVALGDDTTGDYVQQVHGTSNQISVDYESGESVTATISLPSHIELPDGEILLQKTEYWRGGTQQGIIAAQSDSSLRLTAVSGQLQLESNSGDVRINPSTQQTWFNNNFVINGTTGEISTSQGDLILTPNSGNVVINNNLVTNTILSKNSTADNLSIVANEIILQSPDVLVGGGGINGKFQVLDSNGTNAFVIDGANKEAQFGGNLTVDGNLNVTGTLNAVNRTEINIEDNTIRLNTGFTGAPVADAGIIVTRGTANDTAIIWSESNKDWTLTNDGSNYYAIARKYVAVIGDASGTSFDVVHNLGTRDITVMVRENNAEYNVVETDILMKDGNTVTIAFTDAPALNAYKVIIVG